MKSTNMDCTDRDFRRCLGESCRLQEKWQAGLLSPHHLPGAAAENGNDNYLNRPIGQPLGTGACTSEENGAGLESTLTIDACRRAVVLLSNDSVTLIEKRKCPPG